MSEVYVQQTLEGGPRRDVGLLHIVAVDNFGQRHSELLEGAFADIDAPFGLEIVKHLLSVELLAAKGSCKEVLGLSFFADVRENDRSGVQIELVTGGQVLLVLYLSKLFFALLLSSRVSLGVFLLRLVDRVFFEDSSDQL